MWDQEPVDHLYIHGEQGVGDEVMFASFLPTVKAKRITLEVNPKVAELMRKSFPDVEIVTKETRGQYDAKIPMGSLRHEFNAVPYLKPSLERVEHYKRELKKLGPGPYVAVTWLGGTKQTRVVDRSMNPESLRPILDRYTCVSAQYWTGNPYIEQDRVKAGIPKIDDASAGEDLHEQAALFAAVDAVVTVQQTAVHVAGGVGAKTFVLISDKPHWRYGTEGDSLPFYKDVALYRKKDSWDEAISRLKEDLDAHFCRVPRTEQEAA
jgi:ADP-heptose:LPS heptosyltransferase